MDLSLIRLSGVLELTGLSRSRFYDSVARGLFPPSVSIGARAVGWPRYEINAVNAARISGADDEEVRSLVRQLIERRTDVISINLAEIDSAA